MTTAGGCSRCGQSQCQGCHVGGPAHPWSDAGRQTTVEEVVAKALLAYDRDKNGPGFLHLPWEDRSDYGREEYLRPARAVLAALDDYLGGRDA